MTLIVQTAAEAAERYKALHSAKYVRGSSGDCWEWQAQIQGDGYGRFRMGREQLAHRAAVILDGRTIPDGMVVDHTCRNRRCVNPAHLRVVTPKINTLQNSVAPAAINAARTTCSHGHPLSGENLILRKRGGRDCRQCTRNRQRRQEAYKRLADGMVDCLNRAPLRAALAKGEG